MADILEFPAAATDVEPRNIAEIVTADGEVYELYRYHGDQYLRYTMSADDRLPTQVIPLPPDVLAALAKVGVVAVPVVGVVS